MSIRMSVTKDDPVISYSMHFYSTMTMDLFNPGNARVAKPTWKCERTVIWNEGPSGVLRKTKQTDKAEFRSEEQAQAWVDALIDKYGDSVTWKEPDPERPESYYGYAGNWTIEQANGSDD